MNRSAFFAALRARSCTLFGTSLSQGQVATLDAILDEGEKLALPISHVAYCMATAYHEVGSALKPIRENLTYTSATRIRQVWPSRFKSDAAAKPYVRNPQALANFVYGGRLGNTEPNDGWTYRGGGLPQTTGKENYLKVGELIGVDLVKFPQRIEEPRIAVAALVQASQKGLYTGKKLSDFLPGDYFAARAIINGDKNRKENGVAIGAKIAGYAKQFEAALKAAGYNPKPVPNPEPNLAPVEPPKDVPILPPISTPEPKVTFWQIVTRLILALIKRR